jgi:hypothetical protein
MMENDPMRLLLFLLMAADHFLYGEWRWFSRIGLSVMWNMAGCAARRGRLN